MSDGDMAGKGGTEEKLLCHSCVGESYLSAEMQSKAPEAECSYCGEIGHCYAIRDLADRVKAIFENHFHLTSDQPDDWESALMRDPESDYSWDRHGDPVVYMIGDVAQVEEEVAEDIQRILADRYDDYEAMKMAEETAFSDSSYYAPKGVTSGYWGDEWQAIERTLRTEARFFSRRAADHLTKLFAGIDHMRTGKGKPLVIKAGPSTRLKFVYRARVFQSDSRLEAALCAPDREIGSPPAAFAAAGRMNARGISVFYGSNKPTVAIAEVRPPVGAQVAVARFDIIRRLKILDLSALGDVHDDGSYFDPTLSDRLERAAFLRSLSQRITRPVMPDDESFDYLSTQAIADFLATESEVPIDGILFPSVQAAGRVRNLVLFHKAALVEPLELPAGTKVEARLGMYGEDEWERRYTVSETVPKAKPAPAAGEESDWFADFASHIQSPYEPYEFDDREPTLRIALDSIEVHVVKRVQFETEPHRVSRYRWDEDDKF